MDFFRLALAGSRLPGARAKILLDPSPTVIENPFFSLVPAGISTYLLVLLSSAATVIASQALISGAFSLTRQAMLLGYLPHMTIKHTAYHTEGQIYIPEVNSVLAVGLHTSRGHVSRVCETCRRIWYCRDRNHGNNLDSLLHRCALLMGLEQVAGRPSRIFSCL